MNKLKSAFSSRQSSFRRTYLRVNTQDDNTCGSVISGVSDSAHLAAQLLQTLPGSRCCAIAIANATTTNLVCPQVHINSGAVKSSPPLIIESGFTGLLGAHKSAFTVSGSVGVLTYQLESLSGVQLQVMWSVPYDFHIYDSWVNVAAGERGASEALFNDMYRGKHGKVIRAKDTRKVFKVVSNMYAEVDMNNGGKSALIVRLYQD